MIRQSLAVDEIDPLEITHTPDVVGGGARLFDDAVPASSWTTVAVTPTDSGAVRIVYDRAC